MHGKDEGCFLKTMNMGCGCIGMIFAILAILFLCGSCD